MKDNIVSAGPSGKLASTPGPNAILQFFYKRLHDTKKVNWEHAKEALVELIEDASNASRRSLMKEGELVLFLKRCTQIFQQADVQPDRLVELVNYYADARNPEAEWAREPVMNERVGLRTMRLPDALAALVTD